MTYLDRLREQHDAAAEALIVRIARLVARVVEARHHLVEAVAAAERGDWESAADHAASAEDIECVWLGNREATGVFRDMIAEHNEEA